MVGTRDKIPKSTQDRILSEFNHKCSICGKDQPHIHHIDTNHNNNSMDNLLPLCPNCHLNDQHNPTTKIDPLRLKLFRKYKDPTILSSQFEPLFQRFQFLFGIAHEISLTALNGYTADLIDFISNLEMGEYYSKAIASLTNDTNNTYFVADEQRAQYESECRSKLQERSDRIIDLIVELLRYQNWPAKHA